MEACVKHLREILSAGVIHIALLFEAVGLIGAVASIIGLAIMLYDRQRGRKEK